MRKIRNACAHNERIYCIARSHSPHGHSGRILEQYFAALGTGYSKKLDQRLVDLIVYFKYYLPRSEYKRFIYDLKGMLLELQAKIQNYY